MTNLTDGSFLCLDIGSSAVHAVAARISFGKIKATANISVESADAAYAVKSAVDSLEEQIGARFDSAFVTGNFGDIDSEIFSRKTSWASEHKITPQDVLEQASSISSEDAPTPLHIIPLRYDLPGAHNIASPIGCTDRALNSVFHKIAYSANGMSPAKFALHAAHLESEGFFEPMFLLGSAVNNSAAFIDFGAEYTSVSVWTARGPMLITKIKMGGSDITKAISSQLGLSPAEAERLKISTMTLAQTDMDRFTPIDARYDITRFDLNEVAGAVFAEIMAQVRVALLAGIEKYKPAKLYVSGGGAGLIGLDAFLEKAFCLPVKNLGAFGAVNALAEFVWRSAAPRVAGYLSRRAKWEKFFGFFAILLRWKFKTRKHRIIPIMPSTLVWDMRAGATYAKFASANISMIHADVMDGFYVQRIASGIDELKFIRAHTKAHLHVHLMTENPASWAAEAIRAGADTIIVSSGTNGVIRALREIKAAGKRAGIALHPETSLDVIAPILRDVDEVMVMSVIPGAAGQGFIENSVARISALNNTRKRYGLKFKISVDGGINPETARRCWAAGADFLVAGSFLKNAPDFAAAVFQLADSR
jgi:ribulose-phosphate 3-epimerase